MYNNGSFVSSEPSCMTYMVASFQMCASNISSGCEAISSERVTKDEASESFSLSLDSTGVFKYYLRAETIGKIHAYIPVHVTIWSCADTAILVSQTVPSQKWIS